MPEIDVKLFPAQYQLLQAQERNIVAVLSRGYGKSYSLAMWCIKKLLTDSYTGMLICPTYQQLRETVKYLLSHAETMGLRFTLNSRPSWCSSNLSDHKNIFSLDVGDGKHRYLKLASGDRPENIRGTSCDFIAFDECALLREEIVDISMPCLRGRGPDFNYQVAFCTTPRDTSCWLYKRYVESEPPSTVHIKAPATENFIEFTQEKLEYYRSMLTDLMWKREILAEWVDLAANAMFYAFSAANVAKKEPKGKLFLGCDQNVINLESLCGWIDGRSVYVEHEIQIPEAGNPQKVAQEFHKKFKSQSQRLVYLMGDRYGRNRSLTSQSTYYQQLEEELKRLGWRTQDRTNNKNPDVFSSCELVNRGFEKDELFISPNCKEFIRHLKEVRWKDGEFVMDKKLLDSGFCDVIRYVFWKEFGKRSTIKTNLWL